jgi:hypothetical protein
MAVFYVFCLLLVANSQIVTDVFEERRPLIRTQSKADDVSAIHLGPSGEFVEVNEHRHHIAQGDSTSSLSPPPVPVITQMRKCWYSYILGEPDKNECKDKQLHELILNEEHCEFAALQAGACKGPCNSATGHDFNVGLDEKGDERSNATGADGIYASHPLGCFRSRANPNEFYFNPSTSAWPDRPDRGGGTPVCQRRRFHNGTTNADGGCPGKYEKVLDIDSCRTAADCQGYGAEDDFLVGVVTPQEDPPPSDRRPDWMQQYDGKPKGCYIRLEDGKVYYNRPRDTMPDAISGIPVCNITRYVETE